MNNLITRLLLWDCDDRSYSYYIEVSGNSWNWERIADKTSEPCKSWQTLKFTPARPISFIRIVGTHNTANEVFHCVHFECPARQETVTDTKSPRKSRRQPSGLGAISAQASPPETATEAVNIDQDDGNSTDDSAVSAGLP